MRFSKNRGVFGLVFSRRIALKQSGCFGLLGCALALSTSARAQEALRMSLASEEMAEARHNMAKLANANLKYGPVTGRLQASYGMDFSDNINYSSVDPQSDLAVRPGINLAGLWSITEANNLYFSTGLGYLKYIRHSDLDSFYITPDSALAFQVYAGDFVFDFHDRFSWTENGSQTPSISSLSDLGEIQNTIGTKVTWDLNKLIVTAGYDHDMLASTTTNFNYIDRQSELFSGRAALQLNPMLRTGLDIAGGFTSHDKKFNPATTNDTRFLVDNSYFSVGPFVEATLSQYLSTSLAAGYVTYSFDHPIGGPGTRLDDTYYARWSVKNRLNNWLTHSISLQHDRRLGDWYDLADLYSANYSAVWTVLHNVTLLTSFSYYNGKSYYSTQSDDLTWYGLNLLATWQISPKFAANAQYGYSTRQSGRNTGYDQNRLALAISYTF